MEYLKMDIRHEIDSFIRNAFEFYNGRINKFNNKAELIIEWTHHKNYIMGTSRNPNIVIIYPYTILESMVSYHKYFAVSTIIHELFHIDQIIDYARYSYDNIYRDSIEYAVEFQTMTYINNNMMEVIKLCDGNAPNPMIRKIAIGYTRYAPYHRRRLVDHLASIIADLSGNTMLSISGLYNNIADALVNYPDKYLFTITINGNTLIVNDHGRVASLYFINKYFYQYFINEITCLRTLTFDHSSNEKDPVFKIFMTMDVGKLMSIKAR